MVICVSLSESHPKVDKLSNSHSFCQINLAWVIFNQHVPLPRPLLVGHNSDCTFSTIDSNSVPRAEYLMERCNVEDVFLGNNKVILNL
jgi:hypothetical protein